jgi:hypothetical protein
MHARSTGFNSRKRVCRLSIIKNINQSTKHMVRSYLFFNGINSIYHSINTLIPPPCSRHTRLRKMARSVLVVVAVAFLVVFTGSSSAHQLSAGFYSESCPNVFGVVKSVVQNAVSKERRLGASLLRLFFHDCFVNVNSSSSLHIYLSIHLVVNAVNKNIIFKT